MSLKSEVKRLVMQVKDIAERVNELQANGNVMPAVAYPNEQLNEDVLGRIEGTELTASAAINVANAAQATANEALNRQDQNQNLTTAAFLLRVAQEQGLYNEVSVAAQNKLIQVIERL
ncbi:hypothetical protein [Acinetobacter baumannii]|uniref:hypothetical protein n=1 Tax=Acinetobacter baumannii TaxID=470 RepID=UPI001D170180|nr:hypothetical protein [Acinetobacter baumannii]MDC4754089.1 hypothetical protein [Acinetobacter baumannii]